MKFGRIASSRNICHLNELRLFRVRDAFPVLVGLVALVQFGREEGHVELVVAHGVDDRHFGSVDSLQQSVSLLRKIKSTKKSHKNKKTQRTTQILVITNLTCM